MQRQVSWKCIGYSCRETVQMIMWDCSMPQGLWCKSYYQLIGKIITWKRLRFWLHWHFSDVCCTHFVMPRLNFETEPQCILYFGDSLENLDLLFLLASFEGPSGTAKQVSFYICALPRLMISFGSERRPSGPWRSKKTHFVQNLGFNLIIAHSVQFRQVTPVMERQNRLWTMSAEKISSFFIV